MVPTHRESDDESEDYRPVRDKHLLGKLALILLPIFGGVSVYFALRDRDAVYEKAEAARVVAHAASIKAAEHETDIAVIRNDITAVKLSLEKLEKGQQEILLRVSRKQ